jgi:starch phosphorylase
MLSCLAEEERNPPLKTTSPAWARRATATVACSGRFSSNRTIAEYGAEIWNAKPCPVP